MPQSRHFTVTSPLFRWVYTQIPHNTVRGCKGPKRHTSLVTVLFTKPLAERDAGSLQSHALHLQVKRINKNGTTPYKYNPVNCPGELSRQTDRPFRMRMFNSNIHDTPVSFHYMSRSYSLNTTAHCVHIIMPLYTASVSPVFPRLIPHYSPLKNVRP